MYSLIAIRQWGRLGCGISPILCAPHANARYSEASSFGLFQSGSRGHSVHDGKVPAELSQCVSLILTFENIFQPQPRLRIERSVVA